MPHRSKPGVNWDEIRQRYEAGESANGIANSGVGVSKQAILGRIKRHGWVQSQSAKRIAQHGNMIRQQAEALATDPRQPFAVQAAWGKDTPETRAKILAHLEKGATYELAAKAVGLSRMTLHRWREDDPGFAEEIEAARSSHAITHIGVIDYAGREVKDWKASAHLLAKNPLTKADYGDTAKAGGPVIQVVLNVARGSAQPMLDVTDAVTIGAGDD